MNQSVKKKNFKLSFWAFVGVFSLLYIALVDIAEFIHTPVDGLKDTLFMTFYFVAIALMQSMLITIISLNKYIFTFIAPILLFIGTSLTYFFITLRTTLSATIVGLIITNDMATSADLITWPLVILLILSILLSLGFVFVRFKFVYELKSKYKYLTLSIIFILFLVLFSFGKIKRVADQRQPFIIYASISDYLSLRQDILADRNSFVNEKCEAKNDSITVVLVIGESLRPDHLGLNGYKRNTTPFLSQEDNLVSYPNLKVSTFHTAISIPRLLTRADEENPEISYTEQSFITLFKNAGFYSCWIGNQEPLNYFVYFVEESDKVIPVYIGHSLYNYNTWLDGDMLDDYYDMLNYDKAKKLIVLHTIGNHWWYKSHYDERFAQYKPELTSRNMNANTLEQIINSYDNCILYTDWFLTEVIEPLKDKNAVLIYISDHGESLGENGMLLHGALTEETGMAALIFWMSDKYKQNNLSISNNIIANKNLKVDNDILFHTILDCGGVATSVCDTLKSVARKKHSNL